MGVARGALVVGTATVEAGVGTLVSGTGAGGDGVVVVGVVATRGAGAGWGRRGPGRLIMINPPMAMSTNGIRATTMRR